MPETPLTPYGLWPSPISPAQLAQSKRLQDVAWDGERVVWLESRSGHGMIVALDAGRVAPRDITPDFSVRARVGYGGGDFAVHDGHVVFAAGGRLYHQNLDRGAAQPVTPAFGAWAAPAISPDGDWAVAVHSNEGVDSLALVDLGGHRWPYRLASGADFYMQPAWHPSGDQLAWIEWDHPNMPWDGTRLMLAQVARSTDGGLHLAQIRQVAGGAQVAVQQPSFAPDGSVLAYISDETGWGQLYLLNLASSVVRPAAVMDGELGKPSWVQGIRTFVWGPDSDRLYFIASMAGRTRLFEVHLYQKGVGAGAVTQVSLPEQGGLGEYTDLTQPAISRAGQLALVASSPTIPDRLIVHSFDTGKHKVLVHSTGETIEPRWLSTPEPLTWQAPDGARVHGIYYPPAPALASHGKPPLIVRVHGGPTGQSTISFNAQVQFFASRGYAVLDVNYRGSTGYGRDYMLALREQWGLHDVADTVSGAQHLAAQGLVDAQRMVIMGGSAGGYTVLQTLIHHPGVFRAGLCLYGVTNLFTLAADTHKFEARYLDSMIGPLPETAARYRERSPIFNADRIVDPIVVFQGDEDQVVPLAQAETIVAALRRSGTPHEYHVFSGEGHGWRKAETIASFYTLVLRFLKQYVIYA